MMRCYEAHFSLSPNPVLTYHFHPFYFPCVCTLFPRIGNGNLKLYPQMLIPIDFRTGMALIKCHNLLHALERTNSICFSNNISKLDMMTMIVVIIKIECCKLYIYSFPSHEKFTGNVLKEQFIF